VREAASDPQQHDHDDHVVAGIVALLLPTVLMELSKSTSERDAGNVADDGKDEDFERRRAG
jgi:hypothetical protein